MGNRKHINRLAGFAALFMDYYNTGRVLDAAFYAGKFAALAESPAERKAAARMFSACSAMMTALH